METSSVLDKSCGPGDPFPDFNFLTKRLMLKPFIFLLLSAFLQRGGVCVSVAL